MSAKQRNKGFTLIELVVVIAILAILAAFALPRFAQLSEEAHVSSVKATAGAMAAGVALAKAQWVANGLSGEQDDVQGFGNDNIDVSEDGWPVSISGANKPANITAAMCVGLWEELMQSNAPTVSAGGTDTDYSAAATAPECTYTYLLDGLQSPNQKQIVYNASTGEVTTINVN